jgi:hypothetical protein
LVTEKTAEQKFNKSERKFEKPTPRKSKSKNHFMKSMTVIAMASIREELAEKHLEVMGEKDSGRPVSSMKQL